MPKGKFQATDDMDMNGHHIRDWRYLSDLPRSGATTGQAIVFNGTNWAPGAVAGAGTVASVFGRVGAVVAESGDYRIDQIANALVATNVDFSNAAPTFLSGVVVVTTNAVTNMLTLGVSGTAYNNVIAFASSSGTKTFRHDANNVLAPGFYLDDALYAEGLINATRHIYINPSGGGDGFLYFKATPVQAHLTFDDTANLFSMNYGLRVSSLQSSSGTLTVNDDLSVVGDIAGVDGTFTGGLNAETISVTETSLGSKNNITSQFAQVGNTFDGNTVRSFYARQTYSATTGCIATGGALVGYDHSVTLTDNTPTFFGNGVYAFRSAINADGLSISTARPFQMTFTNPNSGQAFSEGYLSIDINGSSGTVVAAYTRARVNSTAIGIGYTGYAIGNTGASGILIGVQGQAVNGHTHTYLVGVDGFIPTAGGGTALNKRMGVRSRGHLLVSPGSVFITSATTNAPSGVSPTFVQANTNTGELYVAGNAEFGADFCLANPTTPTTTTSTGTTGQIAWDSGFVYVCIASNSWRRAAVGTW